MDRYAARAVFEAEHIVRQEQVRVASEKFREAVARHPVPVRPVDRFTIGRRDGFPMFDALRAALEEEDVD